VHLLINPADDVPIYRQIVRQIIDAIAGGQLQPGDRLTSHRELSEQLVIAPLTVKKAYDELERLGYIASQRGRGTFVAEKFPKVPKAVQSAQIAEAARALLSRTYLAGLGLTDAVQALRDAEHELRDSQPPSHRTRGRSA
jgi:GntR family transcriptional regulator